ncbi:trichohyalin-like [Carassius gibelio]|uniref:trichohyalin-like n=1 Tax=Carassius gibelio TaxID=101364 RepID=UPI002277BF34|nr:trichohyalin-like [Carassius gibelio]
MGAAGSHPEQDPRYLEMQRELQRRNEELDRRERELRREMDRREKEIDRRERELRREMDRRERELKRKEEEIDRRESELMREMARRRREERIELMREMARREEEMVGHCERQSVPAFLGLSRIHSDESLEYHFSDPWISFGELKPVRCNSKEFTPPEMSESEDNHLIRPQLLWGRLEDILQ